MATREEVVANLRTVASTAVTSTPTAATGMPEAIARGPCWTRLSCSLPARPTRHRGAVWRELARLHALSLQRSEWALPHSEAGPPDLRGLLQLIQEANGHVQAQEVDPVSAPWCEEQLQETCEHLWDAFFNDVDRLAYRLTTGPSDTPTLDGHARQLEELRGRWVELFRQDFVSGSVTERATARLRACGDALLSARGGRHRAPAGPVPGGHLVVGHPMCSVALRDGSVRCVVPVLPMPTDAWERGFARFEDYAYRPDRSRADLRQGVFVLRGALPDRDAGIARLAARVERYQQSLT